MSTAGPSAAAPAGPALRGPGLGLAAAGALLLGSALLLEGGARRLAFAWLWGFAFLWTLVLGALFFVALHHATGAVWSVVVRRAAEMFAAPVALLAALFVPVVAAALFGGGDFFPWLAAAPDHALAAKSAYLNLPFFLLRAAAFFALWLLFARRFVHGSLRQDDGRPPAETTAPLRRTAGPFLILFAFTVTFAAIDWLMALEPHWFSTIFGVYVFSGMALTALAAVTLAALWLRARGTAAVPSDASLYNLGGLLFGFTCFWGYIAFSQYMLIWYANIPEETAWFHHRLEHGWLPVSAALAVSRFGLPFLLLLPRAAKMNPPALVAASLLVLAGQWLDLYWLVMPQAAVHPVFGLPEAGMPLFALGLVLLWIHHFLGKHAAVAAADPDFGRAAAFHP